MGTRRFIQAIEDQELSLAINGKTFTFHIFAFRDLMYVDISRNNLSIFKGKRVMANQWMLPNYVSEGIGNIRFETYASDSDSYVWWKGFNEKFRLVSYTADEIQKMEEESESRINIGNG